MISSKNIRFHAPSNTYIIPKNSVIDQNVSINGNVIVGPGTHFWKNAKIDGNIQFGKGCTVEGNLKANQIIIGSRSKIKGKINADSDVSLFQNAVVNSIESNGNITIMPGCIVDYANGNTLQVIGRAEIKKIGAITKVTVRADTVAELEEEPIDNELIGEAETEADFKDNKDKEFGKLEENEFAVNTPIHVSSINENETQNISENLILEDNIIDESKNPSEEPYINENTSESSINSDSISTPTFQVENTNQTDKLDIETDTESSENSGVEIIDENDENSPKSFSFSEFSAVPANRPVDVPTDESEEVEIVDGFDESESSNENYVPQTVETPFGTIVVGEKTAPSASSKSSANRSGIGSTNDNANSHMNNNADSTFASVTEISKEEQQADYEAEIRSKTRATPSKVEFRWPSFEAKPTRKTGLRAAAEQQEKAKAYEAATAATISSSSTSSPSSTITTPSKQSASAVQYEEVKVQSVPKQKETFIKSEYSDLSRKANQKIVFEEIDSSEPAVKQTKPAKPTVMQAVKQAVKPIGKQAANPAPVEKDLQQQARAEILLEAISVGSTGSENKPEKNEKDLIEMERSKIWYEERYQEIKPRKKEYPPYI